MAKNQHPIHVLVEKLVSRGLFPSCWSRGKEMEVRTQYHNDMRIYRTIVTHCSGAQMILFFDQPTSKRPLEQALRIAARHQGIELADDVTRTASCDRGKTSGLRSTV